MAFCLLWDKYETALLIDTYLHIEQGKISRRAGITSLSKQLRQKAIEKGLEIDDVYRNENGISMQLEKIAGLFHSRTETWQHNTSVFMKIENSLIIL